MKKPSLILLLTLTFLLISTKDVFVQVSSIKPLLLDWLKTLSQYDRNSDSKVNSLDFASLISSIPTPTTSSQPCSQRLPNDIVLCQNRTYDGWSNSPITINNTNGSARKVICNCRFLNTADRSILRPAIQIDSVDNLLIENSEFDNIRTHVPGDDVGAVKFAGNQNSILRNVTIRNNRFDGIGAHGVSIGDTSPNASNLTITGNEFIGYDGTGENGIVIKACTGPILIEGNNLHGFRPCIGPKSGGNQDCSGTNGPSITIITGDHNTPPFPPRNVTVRNNTIYDNTIGVNINGRGFGISNIVVTGNTWKIPGNNANGTNVVVQDCNGCTIQPN